MPTNEDTEYSGVEDLDVKNQLETSDLDYALKKLATQHSYLFAYHTWPDEHERWVQLAFALLSAASEKPEPEVREAVENLDALDLLEVTGWADDSIVDERTTRTIAELEESEFTAEDAQRGTTAIRDAARSLDARHGGKVQRYLRQYGEQIIAEIHEEFDFENLEDARVEWAFRYWLQNVLNMPVKLPGEGVEAFATEHGASHEELIAAVDRFDLNLALFDDMVAQRELETNAGDDDGSA